MRENLTSLSACIRIVNLNIELFNQDINENKQSLAARGKRTDNLIINLFKGYIAIKDKVFVLHTDKKE